MQILSSITRQGVWVQYHQTRCVDPVSQHKVCGSSITAQGVWTIIYYIYTVCILRFFLYHLTRCVERYTLIVHFQYRQ